MRRANCSLLAFLLIAPVLVACGGQQPDTSRTSVSAATAATQARWIVLSENPAMRMSLDSSRIATRDGRTQVWLAFDLAEPWPAIEDLKAPYRHYEVHEDVDCSGRRARGLAMRFVDTTGATYDKPPIDSVWNTFAAHPLTENAFGPLCAKLSERKKR